MLELINKSSKYSGYKLSSPKKTQGTLVETDYIYIEVWREILKKYYITIDTNFFNHFIKGKSDKDFLKYLIPEINVNEVNQISNLKDEKFIDYIEKNNSEILHEKVIDFFEKNKNKKIAIVTSCNRKAAKFIIKYTNLLDYVNIIISADDCKFHKPHPEPYLQAVSKLNVDKEDCVIFEDSLSGYKSAINSEIKNISLKINYDTNKTIKNLTYL